MKTFKYISQLLVVLLTLSSFSMAESARELESDSNKALTKFYNEVGGAKRFLSNAKGYLVFPDVKEAGFFIGGKYGEGILRIDGVTKSHFSITSASIGMQMGFQTHSLIIVVTSDRALRNFITDDEWESDLNINVALGDWNLEEEGDDIDFGTSLVGFVFDAKGMMGNFSMEGTKFERIVPD